MTEKPKWNAGIYQRRVAEVTKKRIYDAMKALGEDAAPIAMARYAGLERHTVYKYLPQIKAGWRPE